MNNVSTAGKALTVLFTVLFLFGCTSAADKEAEAEAQRQAEMAAQQAAEEEARRQAEAAEAARIQALADAAAAAGSTIYFGFDEYSLTAAAQDALDAHVALAKTNSDSIRLEGHTDERGTREYNMALGERRAKAVEDYMVVNGISRSRITTVSYGEERPAAAGSGEANWRQNRRVEIR